MWRELFFRNISTYIEIINQYLSENYEPQPLNQYFKILGGYAFKSKQYKDRGVPVIRISDFQNERIVLHKVRYYTESPYLEKYELHEGDIIIAMTGGTIGKLAIVQAGLGKLYLNQRVGKFQLKDKNLFYEKYVYWIARGVEEKVKSLAWGGAQPNVSSKKIESMKFPLPTIDIQKKIVEFLSDFEENKLKKEVTYFNQEVERKILGIQDDSVKIFRFNSEVQKQKHLITQLKQAILQEAIQGKLTAEWRKQNPNIEPADQLLERVKAEKQQLIAEKKIKKQKPSPPITQEEIPFKLPEGWVWCRLGEVSLSSLGKMLDSGKNKGEYKPYLRNLNVKWKKFDYSDIKTMRFEPHEKEKYSVRKGDVMICEGGYPGRAAIWEKEESIMFQKALHRVRFLNMPIYAEIFVNFLILIDYNKEIEKYFTGSGIQHLTGRALKKMIIPLPSLAEQSVILQKVDSLMQKVNTLETQVQQSEAHAKMLMQAVLKEAFEKNI